MQNLRSSVESEIQTILMKKYGQAVEPGTPLRYYLDFKNDDRLVQLRGVLEKMDEGRYGVCILCKGKIPEDELRYSVISPVCKACSGCGR